MKFKVMNNLKAKEWQVISHCDILFIIIMQTKSATITQTVNTRSSRRLTSKLQSSKQGNDGPEEKIEFDSSDNNNPNCIHIDQQLKLKTEKESTSLANSAANDQKEKVRRVTRSFCNLSSKINNEIDIQVDQFTPENNLLSKIQDQQTCKKICKSTSAQDCNDVQLSDIIITNKKLSHKTSEIFTSPYSQMRKSYRKIHKRQIITIPYRKCHDALQGRIVAILNKLENGKNCLRDFEGLIQKMGKIANKDIMNRFIISGIKTIINLTVEKNIYDPKIINKLQQEEKKLQQKIIEELDCCGLYQHDLYHKNHQIRLSDNAQIKGLMIRKIYNILRRKYPKKREQLRLTLLNQCQKLIECQANMGKVMKFVRNRLQGQL